MKIITWNIHKVAYEKMKEILEYLKNKNCDVCLLQEVYVIPAEFKKDFHIVRGEMNAILVKKTIGNTEKIDLNNISDNSAINDYFVACEVKVPGKSLVFISVYNYFDENNNKESEDVKKFKEFLKIVYEYLENNKGKKIIIIGGDFNMDEKFKTHKLWVKCSKEMIQEFSKLEHEDPLVEEPDEEKRYTWINPNSKDKYKLDYLFLPKQIKSKIEPVDEKEIFNQRQKLSDHLPIIAEIEI
jgi:exonuclease III